MVSRCDQIWSAIGILIDKMGDSKALLPGHAMPIEPPAMHPRVAAQEERFIVFGKDTRFAGGRATIGATGGRHGHHLHRPGRLKQMLARGK